MIEKNALPAHEYRLAALHLELEVEEVVSRRRRKDARPLLDGHQVLSSVRRACARFKRIGSGRAFHHHRAADVEAPHLRQRKKRRIAFNGTYRVGLDAPGQLKVRFVQVPKGRNACCRTAS